MARRLSAQENTLTLHDNISNSDIVLSYRMPTTKERTDYQNMAVKRKRNKIDFQSVKARQKFGLDILTGIREGDFEIEKTKGKFVTISSDSKSEFYDEKWKKHIEEHAIDIVEILAAQVFDGSVEIDGDAQD